MKSLEKLSAIRLRKQGHSYGEILAKVPVAKSTLSLWLRSVELAKRQQQKFTEKKKLAQMRGAQARHLQRLTRTDAIINEAQQAIGALSKHEKLLIGAVLYWAEGSKQREGYWGAGVQFGNSDARMVRLFQKWLVEVMMVAHKDIKYEIYLHENHKHRIPVVRRHWSQQLGITTASLTNIYFKRNKGSNRKNQGNGYYGLVRLRVRSSSTLNRKITGWVQGIVENWGVV